MSRHLFEWDSHKAKSNKKKHGVDFTEAKSIFDDDNMKIKIDDRYEYGEDRFNSLGTSDRGNLLNVTHTPRGERTRIISARKAGKKDKKRFGLW